MTWQDDDTYGYTDDQLCEGNGHLQYFRAKDGGGTCYCRAVSYPSKTEKARVTMKVLKK
jgi:hypothetical protein